MTINVFIIKCTIKGGRMCAEMFVNLELYKFSN